MKSYTQRGSTLIISMIILAVLMLIGVTSMITSDTAFRLAGNLQFQDIALNSAEATMSTVENNLKAGTINPNDSRFFVTAPLAASSSGLYPMNAGISPIDLSWDNDHSATTTQGRYIVELMSTNSILIGSSVTVGGTPSYACNKVNTYRITARGTGLRGATKLVQSYYSVLQVC